MSNHSGSYLLNEVLHLLDQRGVFDLLGTQRTQDLVLEIVRLSRRYDCNSGEILDEMEQRVGICSWCLTAQPDLIDGVCSACRATW